MVVTFNDLRTIHCYGAWRARLRTSGEQQFLEPLDQEDLLCPLNGILGDRPGFPHLLVYVSSVHTRPSAPTRRSLFVCDVAARIGSLVPALWTGWSWQTRFSGLPGCRHYSVLMFNSERDIPRHLRG